MAHPQYRTKYSWFGYDQSIEELQLCLLAMEKERLKPSSEANGLLGFGTSQLLNTIVPGYAPLVCIQASSPNTTARVDSLH